MTKAFKPMLAPNEIVDLSTLKYPLLASFKLDGIRCIFIDGKMLSRSLKPIPNIQLQERFKHLKELSLQKGIILDGELYSHGYTFQVNTSIVMSKDKHPGLMAFHAFDLLYQDDANSIIPYTPFKIRSIELRALLYDIPYAIVCEQIQVESSEEVKEWLAEALLLGYEGLILKNPNGYYKFGRGTVKEGLIYKLKPYRTFDAKIIGVEQATAVNEDVATTTNELGRSVTSKKKGDRHLVNMAANFTVLYEGKELSVVIAQSNAQKTAIWEHKSEYFGLYIEYKAMLVGAKDLPRHPVFLRFRGDL